MSEQEQVPLSEELLTLMRRAAATLLRLHEPFISSRALLLALLDDPHAGSVLAGVVRRDKLEELPVPEDNRRGLARAQERGLDSGELPAIVRFDTLGFKTPDGKTTVLLSREAYAIFNEGARRVEDRYLPKHLAYGLAAEAVKTNGVLSALNIEPGSVTEAIYKS
ncbi:MAG: hypothetical protein M3R30_05000 [Candidatus Eremiobacteraeota bacterium]|nr:hypothetical protein [Candidatus Eremiobacteraeota bacterium]